MIDKEWGSKGLSEEEMAQEFLKFYDHINEVLKTGHPLQKALALEGLKLVQQAMRERLEENEPEVVAKIDELQALLAGYQGKLPDDLQSLKDKMAETSALLQGGAFKQRSRKRHIQRGLRQKEM